MVWRTLKSWTFAWGAAFAVAGWWILQVLPTASWYFDAKAMLVPDAPLGDPVVMAVDREIHRPIHGTWIVTVRKQEGCNEGVCENPGTGGGWVVYCNAIGESDYTPRASLPDPLDLEWWTDGQCRLDEPGRYFITTTWRFYPPGLPGNRRTRPLVSNAFRITEVPEL